jgi:hypothetical protein
VLAENEPSSAWPVPEGVAEADVTGADPPEENIAIPLGVAGGDGGLAIRVALNIHENGSIVEQGSSPIRFIQEHNTKTCQKDTYQ